MKTIILIVLAFVALNKAETDWSQIKHAYITVSTNVPPRFQPRIVGGKEASRHQFPHQVALITDRDTFCGGSILKTNVILTAAHCVDGVRGVAVIAGAHNMQDSKETSRQTIIATKFKIHEGWDRSSIKNDIALILLPESLKFNNEVKPIALYTGNSLLVGVDATVSGWGRISDQSQSITDKLRYVTSKIISNEDCKKIFGDTITGGNVCLTGQDGKGSCNGDSGGPLHIAENNQLFEAGIVSFGAALGCQMGFPTAYTRVSSYIDWINKNSV